ncbi:response regulator transcription factor [Desulfosporosinus sp. PR]|uniref:response regulator transcription factor n=1 Tax=Candidatus Desulfosporosinus nitrosoreducens TaxID=3401928 RepID=UPI0027F879D6|nr:response regulator transcription factor [Desulfosporosinus sp. PR]MDQ7092206.1 response regulator transcription factor [Desulfosporosinus sp. PR]
MTKKVLIADDEARMRKLVGDFLRKEGYDIIEAKDGKEALDAFQENEDTDLIILDVMMPRIDGWIACKEIRKTSRVPIIMLTARAEEADELFGFDLGVDEYVTKPFSPRILVARIQSLLRRTYRQEEDEIAFNGLSIDTAGYNVYLDGNSIDLSPKEYELLLYLARNEGRVLSRNQILNTVWDYNYFGDARTVDTHIKKLRIKLGDRSELIQTVRGVGYKFEASD